MLGDKMPDSPDCKVQLGSPNGLGTLPIPIPGSCNGNLSPIPPNLGRSPSPSISHSPTAFHRLESNEIPTKQRQVITIKRFLAVLQHCASSISAEVGDRVHALILSLMSATVTIEEFQQKIQDITNYPFRSFAMPFLKARLPALQMEVLQSSRQMKQTPLQYLRYQGSNFLECPSAPSKSVLDPYEIFQSEPKESKKRIMHNRSATRLNNGRRNESDCSNLPVCTPRHAKSRLPEFEEDNLRTSEESPAPKRHRSMSTSRTSPVAPTSQLFSPGTGYRMEETPSYCYRDARFERMERDYCRPLCGPLCMEEREMEEEWRNIHTMLNCILGMVEKTKRALVILQRRSSEEKVNELWPRRHLDVDRDAKKRHHDFNSHYQAAEDRVSEVRRRAENAVNEVKRQAVAELQKAVSAAESKAQELVAAERLKMERLLAEARRQSSEESASLQEESSENCWNCGRKAQETCGGCNMARYCGSFCQHKHWDQHHKTCGLSTSCPVENGSPSDCTLDLKTLKNDE